MASKLKILLLFLFFILMGLVGKLIVDAGYFKKMTDYGLTGCEAVPGAPGPEDFVYSTRYQILFLSSDDRPNRGYLGEKNGSIWMIRPRDLYRGKLTSDLPFEFHPHGIAIFETPTETLLYVINHKKELSTIEVFSWSGEKLEHKKTISDPLLVHPNDLFVIAPDIFYVSHDHSSWGLGFITLYQNGNMRLVADGIYFANGITVDRKNSQLYNASTLGKKISIYQIQGNLNLVLEKNIPLESGPDNIYLDHQGTLWVATHSNIFALLAHMRDHDKFSPFDIYKIKNPGTEPIIEKVLASDGRIMSGGSGAYPVENRLFIGSIYANHFLVCPYSNQ